MIRLLTFMTFTATCMTLLLLSLTEAPIMREFAKPPEWTPEIPMVVYCEAANRAILEAVVADYQQVSNDRVELRFGSSQELLSEIKANKGGDIFLPANESFLTEAFKEHLVNDFRALARKQVVLAVHVDNPLNIETFEDLLQENVRLVQADPESTTIGKVTKERLSDTGNWDRLEQVTRTFVPSESEAGELLLKGDVDAAIVDNTLVHGNSNLKIIPIEELDNLYINVTAGPILTSSKHAEIDQFLQFLMSEGARRHFFQVGFSPPLEEVYWDDHGIAP
ncbi:MAG TPA: substrate-binding domain-containing protein [Planctomicrobium sp.]|nr:substrate-binding domain-containing protein [Planctomicrobium sp.]